MRLKTALRAALAGITLVLGACDSEEDLKRAGAELAEAPGAEFFWFSPHASRFVVMMAPGGVEKASDMATALAWPDRLVLVLPPQAQTRLCGDVIDTAATAAMTFATKNGLPSPDAPLVIGMEGAGDAAIRFALSATPQQSNGAVAFDYCPAVPLSFCGDRDGPDSRGKIPVVAVPDPAHCTPQDLGSTVARFEDGRAVAAVEGQRIDLMATVVSQMLGTVASSKAPSGSLDLPLIELPASGKDDRLAIILTGDGGWANIDKTLGEELAKRGVAVVGFDTLKYFWKRKTPAEAARDLARVIAHYSNLWQRQRVMLVGYSFGADALPFLWNSMDDASRAKVAGITLIGLAEEASFEITVGGWVGIEPAETAPTLPEIKKIKGPHIVCIYGEEENSDACSKLKETGVEVIALPGDHHFDGHYRRLTELVLGQFADK